MPGVHAEGFGDPQKADLPLIPQCQHGRHKLGDGMVVLAGSHTMQMVDVDVLHLKPAQAVFEAARKLRRGDQPLAARYGLLGRDDDVFAPRVA